MCVQPLSILLLGNHQEMAAIISEAAKQFLPGTTVIPVKNLDLALKRDDAPKPQMMVLIHPESSDMIKSAAATDETGLPRWGTISFGADYPVEGVEVISPKVRDAELMASVLKAAFERHLLKRQNMRFQGDLQTVARRINHDLRTQLGGIISNSEVLKEVLETSVPSQEDLIKPLFEAVETMTKLIEQVSFIAKATAAPLPKSNLPMATIVWAALQRLENRVLKAKASVIQPAAWPTVPGVASWLERVWMILITNAIQYGGTPPKVEVAWSEGEGEFRFCVIDNGKGVPLDMRSRLFQAFHSLHALDSAPGLGLAIVQRLIELQGGQCGYEPLFGQGSRFFFTLPAANGYAPFSGNK